VALILNIETSTTVCSVALARDGKVISSKELDSGYSHAENLTLFIETVLLEAEVIAGQLDAVAISQGPGSYTGLRIGTSVAKGLCYGLEIPLLAVETLQAMSLDSRIPAGYIRCPMIDARRMEVYCAIYNEDNEIVEPTEAKIIASDAFSDITDSEKIVLFGNGAEKCKTILPPTESLRYIDNVAASALLMATLSENEFYLKHFKDVAYFEPFYLKDFVATTPKKLV